MNAGNSPSDWMRNRGTLNGSPSRWSVWNGKHGRTRQSAFLDVDPILRMCGLERKAAKPPKGSGCEPIPQLPFQHPCFVE